MGETGFAGVGYGADTTGDGPTSRLDNQLRECRQSMLEHEYFARCRQLEVSRDELLHLIEQLYCFSVFFERVLARRVAEYSSAVDGRLVRLAREHLRDEVAHSELFRACLKDNGLSDEAIEQTRPSMFTKALFGYLLATVVHDDEYVSNIAIMQVMESIGHDFFGATLGVMRHHGLSCGAFALHSEADAEHQLLGHDMIADFDAATERSAAAVIDDLYGLMAHVLRDWLPESKSSRASGVSFRAATPSRITALRPPPVPATSSTDESA